MAVVGARAGHIPGAVMEGAAVAHPPVARRWLRVGCVLGAVDDARAHPTRAVVEGAGDRATGVLDRLLAAGGIVGVLDCGGCAGALGDDGDRHRTRAVVGGRGDDVGRGVVRTLPGAVGRV